MYPCAAKDPALAVFSLKGKAGFKGPLRGGALGTPAAFYGAVEQDSQFQHQTDDEKP